jgi:hypothetical protein
MTHSRPVTPGKWVLAWVAAVAFVWLVLGLGAWLVL